MNETVSWLLLYGFALILWIKTIVLNIKNVDDHAKFEKHLQNIPRCTVCAKCKRLICPGQPYGAAIEKINDIAVTNILPYVHYTEECSIVGSYIGIWE